MRRSFSTILAGTRSPRSSKSSSSACARILRAGRSPSSSRTALRSLIAEKGYDPVYGARPLKRAIQRLIQDPLAVKILGGEFKDGDRVEVEAETDELSFHRGAPPVFHDAYEHEQRTIH